MVMSSAANAIVHCSKSHSLVDRRTVDVQAQQAVDRLADSVAQQSQPSNGVHPADSNYSGRAGAAGAAGAPAAEPAVLLCGDFNAEPRSEELQVPMSM